MKKILIFLLTLFVGGAITSAQRVETEHFIFLDRVDISNLLYVTSFTAGSGTMLGALILTNVSSANGGSGVNGDDFLLRGGTGGAQSGTGKEGGDIWIIGGLGGRGESVFGGLGGTVYISGGAGGATGSGTTGTAGRIGFKSGVDVYGNTISNATYIGDGSGITNLVVARVIAAATDPATVTSRWLGDLLICRESNGAWTAFTRGTGTDWWFSARTPPP